MPIDDLSMIDVRESGSGLLRTQTHFSGQIYRGPAGLATTKENEDSWPSVSLD